MASPLYVPDQSKHNGQAVTGLMAFEAYEANRSLLSAR